MRALITNPRILRTGQPLALTAIRQSAPAVFAEGPHHSRGPRYQYVPTIKPLEFMIENGWGVYEVSQQRSRVADKDHYTKHMVRMRKLDHFFDDRPGDHIIRQDIPEVIIINAHDGTAAYTVKAGIFRFICSNGLMVGKTMGSFVVRHTVGPATSQAVLDAGERVITEKFPLLLENVGEMKKVILNTEKQYHLAQVAMDLRYGGMLPPFQAADLVNHVRRDEDKEPTLWNVLNRVQENIMDGGWEVRTAMLGRRSAVRPVERVGAVAKINGGLWDAATEMLVA